MPLQPKNQDAAIQSLARAVDILGGQVAAIMAYMAHTTAPVDDKDIRAIQGLAQSLAPSGLAAPGGTHPMLAASQGVEKIQSMVKNIQTIRSAGPDK